jgi:hypothetical protein
MGKVLFVVAVGIGAVVFAKRHVLSRDGSLEGWVERLPDNAPPKWAFKNISAIRENTDRILELLEREQKASTGRAAMPLHDTDET